MTPLSMKIFDLSFKVGEEEGERLTIKIVWCPKERKGDRWSEHTGVRRSKLDIHPFRQSQRLESELKKKHRKSPTTHHSLLLVNKHWCHFPSEKPKLAIVLHLKYVMNLFHMWCVWVLCFHGCKHVPCVVPMKARRVSDHGDLELQVVVYCGILF